MNPTYVELTAITAIVLLLIREGASLIKYFGKNKNLGSDDIQLQVLGQMEKIANNDLVHITAAVQDGTKRIVDIIHADNIKIIEVLGEIKGKIK